MDFFMNSKLNNNSVGIVEPKTVEITKSLKLDCGKVLDGFSLVYETYGKLNNQKNNYYYDENNKIIKKKYPLKWF